MARKTRTIPKSLLSDRDYDASEEKKKNIIGLRIAELRKKNDLSLANLSELLGRCGVVIQPGALSKWELGVTVPSAYQLISVCRIFHIASPEYFTAEGEKHELNAAGMKKLEEYKSDLIASGRYTPVERQKIGNIIYIDMPVSCLTVSAGTGAFLDEGSFEMISCPKNSVPAGAEFGIRVSGDSMEPIYKDGQIVWVQSCTSLKPGEVGIFIYDGEGYVKMYDEQDPTDPEAFTDSMGVCHKQPVLISYNKAYAPREISPNAPFEIAGRVLN